MCPIKIAETNHTFTRPGNMTEEECFDMPVVAGMRDDGFAEIVSCWKLSPEELEEIIRTGVVYHGTIGAGIPPMWMSVFKPKMPVMPEEQPESKIIGINGNPISNN